MVGDNSGIQHSQRGGLVGGYHYLPNVPNPGDPSLPGREGLLYEQATGGGGRGRGTRIQ